jgi:hypothetical protein
MAFQWVFDKAESIAPSKRAIVGQSITRNNTVRAVSRGVAPQRFTVKLPDGMPWTQVADDIAAIDAADRFTVENIGLTNPGYSDWLNDGPLTPGATWDVICIQLPDYTINPDGLVFWSGPFVFYESIV